VQDLYVERVNRPDDPTQYEFQGEMRDLTVVEEVVAIKGAAPEILRVYETHHGPIINDVVGSLGPDAEPIALRWTALDKGRLFRAVVQLNLAQNWAEFRQALRYWDVPSQNFVYADVDGNIGYQSPGLIPIRAEGHRGLVPVPGWTGAYEWQGYIPFDELPVVYNPERGFVSTANNKVVPDDYPYLLATDWAAPYRAQRITDLLTANQAVTLDDVRDIQAQTYSIPAEKILPHLLASEPAGTTPEEDALGELRDWDRFNEADRAGAAIYEAFYWQLVQHTFADELGENLTEDYLDQSSIHMPLLVKLMEEPDSPWFDNITTAEVETRDEILRRSFKDAVAYLAENYGTAPHDWQWGQLHTMTFVHVPLGQSGIGPLESIFNSKAIPARGSNVTVNAASFDYPDPFTMQRGVSQRLVIDVGNWANARAVHTTGQSGHAFHPHRQDFIELWQNIEYHPLIFTRANAEANPGGTLILRPQ
jgi:penicillin G amidase